MNIIKIHQVQKKTGKGKSQIYADIQNHTFPAPIKLGLRSSGWIEEEIDDWIEQRKSEREVTA